MFTRILAFALCFGFAGAALAATPDAAPVCNEMACDPVGMTPQFKPKPLPFKPKPLPFKPKPLPYKPKPLPFGG